MKGFGRFNRLGKIKPESDEEARNLKLARKEAFYDSFRKGESKEKGSVKGKRSSLSHLPTFGFRPVQQSKIHSLLKARFEEKREEHQRSAHLGKDGRYFGEQGGGVL